MADLLALSSRIIDEAVTDEPVNRVTNELSELADDLAIVESFSHCVALATDEGLVCFDVSGARTGPAVVAALRGWNEAPVHTIVYTHGHIDHVGGSPAVAADAEGRGDPAPQVVGHQAVAARFDRYDATNDFNLLINSRQFGGVNQKLQLGIGGDTRFLPEGALRPTRTFLADDEISVGGERIQLHHARGETDDHLWAWLPDRRWLFAGDFLIWNFPNAGNPQKVQRYPLEWATALRAMAAERPELFVPAHGLPIADPDRIERVLHQVATVLEQLVADVLDAMNAGATLDEVVHGVRVAPDALSLPFLRPFYDEPEFVVHNVWRQYGGWWDGDFSRLKPARAADLAQELARLAGGVTALTTRAQELAEAAGGADDLRVACHLVELAAQAAPEDRAVHEARAAVYEQRRKAESSLMAKGLFRAAAAESELIAGVEGGGRPTRSGTPLDGT
ncbi:MAG: Alkyl sulfatase and related hydrolases, MBL-fold metallo-hydrolase superfamily [uncultured Acidimicrobiales bacterium]|uniref:Alkyl sulfatase and related hydrolases, MBL-fold metallo-hydrolase superfamily n=1 Tax=uncultured Acidimicrobiales bacterium TaxID=310071 RepID=A0A6J4HXQ1_9ACTN|nr:MAG: Alkyl sulfatase and related hydrolases, MBL-fold metallo-hydrolase superfamily [uncultured Acidimicrobiales bacterium]